MDMRLRTQAPAREKPGACVFVGDETVSNLHLTGGRPAPQSASHPPGETGERMIKQDIIQQVIERTGLPRTKAEAAVDTIVERLKRAMTEGERIELRGFGVFNVRPRKTGIGRNPRTGTEVTISPGRAVRFKPGKELHLIE